MHEIERLAYGNRWRARNPIDKVVLAGGFLVLSVSLPPLPGAGLALAASAGAAILGAGIPVRSFLRLMALPLAFVLSGGAALALSVGLEGGVPSLQLTREGLATAGAVSLRALAATASLVLLITTTPLTDLISLMRRLRVPALGIDIAMLIHRFSVLAFDVAAKGWTAQAGRLGYVDLRRSIRSVGMLAASLLPRLLDAARRLDIGLAARGFAGELRVLTPAPPVSLAFVAGALAAHGLVGVVSLTWGG